MIDELLARDGLGQAEAIARGDTTPAELLEAAIARAEATNPRLNFIAQPMFARARAAAAGAFSGPFAGVPFLVKDLHMAIPGERMGEGSKLWDGARADYTSTLYHRYVAAGLNTFAKTTTPEFGLTVTTESAATGLTRNPWNLAHSAGGSSGGAACAVAAGVVALAHASDGGGSIRCPASACGVFGLKPSRGRVPMGPQGTEGWLGLGVVHAVSRSVRDSAALLDASHGAENGSRYTAPAPEHSFLSEVTRAPGALRVAVMRTPITGVPVHADVLAALDDTAKLLESLGHHVEVAQPALDGAALGSAMVAVLGSATAFEVGERLAALGRDDAGSDLETVTQMFVHIGRSTGGVQIMAANALFQQAAITVADFMDRYDIILSPVFAQPPIDLGKIDLSPTDMEAWTANILGYSPFTALANWTGQPAMSLPLGMSSTGLPIGVMAMGRYGAEGLLYRLAGQVEAAAPWAGRRPAV
ncbi:amidase [Polymorphobacter fuscus]|uniref:Amidase n=1 Tax=Sandarakinorhabdus fusca TaxID=1439888 RepID=A0A7C9KVK4_9SPHN|nr:amidase family protein [Polymorphobacter fuscus]KAB7648459.1 amidase [Polymorphobacter fuscus]MQT15982.1 amidase [Polymorphobacter fuscus]NJC07741.1 amidase/6-aminohexanoate-cyclic-dimer hydrolase [Polymorphobacter fuscus]